MIKKKHFTVFVQYSFNFLHNLRTIYLQLPNLVIIHFFYLHFKQLHYHNTIYYTIYRDLALQLHEFVFSPEILLVCLVH